MSDDDASADGSEQYEVVIHADGGVEKEHAELLRKRLIQDGFYEDVVSVRPLAAGTPQQEAQP